MFTKIIQELIQSGMTETEIASDTGVTQPTINRIRNGNQKPMGDLAIALVNLRQARDPQYKQATKAVKKAA